VEDDGETKGRSHCLIREKKERYNIEEYLNIGQILARE
jgi:hypothetical protein